jgi:hypothetical protein
MSALKVFSIHLLPWICLVVIPSHCLADIPKQVEEFPLKLNEQTLQSWRDHILPADSELDFQKIPWLTSFKDGILTADQKERPLLLWTMNGHPLGCT